MLVYHKYNTNWCSPVGTEHLVKESEEEESEEGQSLSSSPINVFTWGFHPKLGMSLDIESEEA